MTPSATTYVTPRQARDKNHQGVERVNMVFAERRDAGGFVTSLTLALMIASGAAWADDDDSGVSDGDEGGEVVWIGDDGGAPYEGDGEVLPVSIDDGAGADCDDCAFWTTGGDVGDSDATPRAEMETTRGETPTRQFDRRGQVGGGCSPDGFIPLPYRCNW
jgi:hypothetical protein